MVADFLVLEDDSDLKDFVRVRKPTSPILSQLVAGKPVFIPTEDHKEKYLNKFYEAAKRRGFKCTMEKGEFKGDVGYLLRFHKDNERKEV